MKTYIAILMVICLTSCFESEKQDVKLPQTTNQEKRYNILNKKSRLQHFKVKYKQIKNTQEHFELLKETYHLSKGGGKIIDEKNELALYVLDSYMNRLNDSRDIEDEKFIIQAPSFFVWKNDFLFVDLSSFWSRTVTPEMLKADKEMFNRKVKGVLLFGLDETVASRFSIYLGAYYHHFYHKLYKFEKINPALVHKNIESYIIKGKIEEIEYPETYLYSVMSIVKNNSKLIDEFEKIDKLIYQWSFLKNLTEEQLVRILIFQSSRQIYDWNILKRLDIELITNYFSVRYK
ncbi:hypothetical protein AD998_20035 [bacterium 336/3]|nr:hypothetical protein AD998_20035 [bacterium 336/3]